MERYTALSSRKTNSVYNEIKLLILGIPSADRLSGAEVIVTDRDMQKFWTPIEKNKFRAFPRLSLGNKHHVCEDP